MPVRIPSAGASIHVSAGKYAQVVESCTEVCVCLCVICTFRGGSLCSVGLDASFGSGLLRPLCDVVSLPYAESEPLYLLARYPECLLSRASSRKAGGRHPQPRSPPAPVELGLVGTEGGVFSVSCVWGLEGWGVGVGTSADP